MTSTTSRLKQSNISEIGDIITQTIIARFLFYPVSLYIKPCIRFIDTASYSMESDSIVISIFYIINAKFFPPNYTLSKTKYWKKKTLLFMLITIF